jgi:hypothetical protein
MQSKEGQPAFSSAFRDQLREAKSSNWIFARANDVDFGRLLPDLVKTRPNAAGPTRFATKRKMSCSTVDSMSRISGGNDA